MAEMIHIPSKASVCVCVHFYTLDNYDPEGYNPESPGLTGAGRNQYRQFIPRVQTQRSNLIGLTSSEGQGSRGRKYLPSQYSFFSRLVLSSGHYWVAVM